MYYVLLIVFYKNGDNSSQTNKCISGCFHTRVHNMSVSHHTEQKIHLFFIFETKNVCLLFTSVSDFGL